MNSFSRYSLLIGCFSGVFCDSEGSGVFFVEDFIRVVVLKGRISGKLEEDEKCRQKTHFRCMIQYDEGYIRACLNCKSSFS